MKAFFEEYGFVVIAAVVVLLLVGMTSGVKETVESKISGLVTTVANTAESYIPSSKG